MAELNTAELQSLVDSRSEEEREYLRRYLAYLAQSREPENGAELDRAWEAMRAGDRIALTDLKSELEASHGEGR